MSTIAITTPQTPAAEAAALRNTQPVGPGGLLGHLGRMIVMVFTCGFVFPNVWVEGMNASEIDRKNKLDPAKR